ncbi:MAG TPA: lysozyme [bacterium]|nr:lysozyme [bacterium]
MEKAKRLIKEFEGLRLTAYLCPAGVWTIGYGHTKGVKRGMKIDQAQADRLLDIDLIDVARSIRQLVKVNINDNQAQALVSFVFNIGYGAFEKSTLLRKINNRDFLAASLEFRKWVYAKGIKLPGLVRRRSVEKDLFNEPVT